MNANGHTSLEHARRALLPRPVLSVLIAALLFQMMPVNKAKADEPVSIGLTVGAWILVGVVWDWTVDNWNKGNTNKSKAIIVGGGTRTNIYKGSIEAFYSRTAEAPCGTTRATKPGTGKVDPPLHSNVPFAAMTFPDDWDPSPSLAGDRTRGTFSAHVDSTNGSITYMYPGLEVGASIVDFVNAAGTNTGCDDWQTVITLNGVYERTDAGGTNASALAWQQSGSVLLTTTSLSNTMATVGYAIRVTSAELGGIIFEGGVEIDQDSQTYRLINGGFPGATVTVTSPGNARITFGPDPIMFAIPSSNSVVGLTMDTIWTGVAKQTGPVPAGITRQPQDVATALDSDATITARATGTSPLAYQWKFNGGDLPGQTSATLTLTNVQASQQGSYTLAVTNAFGSALSLPARLAVAVPFAGLAHTALGDATLSVQSNQLTASNLGSSGQDGVSIALPSTLSGLDVHWQPLDPSAALPFGAYIQEQVVGTANGVTNGVLGTVTMTKYGTSDYAVSADFSPIGASTCTVQAYRNGVLVAQATNQPGASLMASCNIWGESGCIPPMGPIFGGGWDWTNDALITLAGGPSVLCDHLYITPENVPGSSALTAFQITASQVPSLSVTAETVSPLLVNLSQNGQNMTLQWLGTGVLQESSDLTSWSDLIGAASPYAVQMSGTNQFFRIRQPSP
jgi:hypothetical protein